MSNNIKVYVVEDNAFNRASLEAILESNDFELVGSTASAEQAWMELKNLEVSIVLIDINLAGEKDGLWLAERIKRELDFPIIYLTAFGDKETLERVKSTNPEGYLMKPYNEPTLLATIDIALKSKHQKQEEKQPENAIYIKDSYLKVKLNTSDIDYVQSDGNYIHIYAGEKNHLVRGKLVDFLQELPHTTFYQVHQRYLINLDKIDQIGNGYVFIKGTEIPVSRRYRNELNEKLNIFDN